MRKPLHILVPVLVLVQIFSASSEASAQAGPENLLLQGQSDTLPVINPSEARDFIYEALRDSQLWKPGNDSLLHSLQRLLDHTRAPFDTTRQELLSRDFSSIPVHTSVPELIETKEVKWLNDSMFVIDPQGWNRKLYIKEELELVYPVNLSVLSLSDSLLDENGMLDSSLFVPDTISREVVDLEALNALEISLYYFRNETVSPSLSDPGSQRTGMLSQDRQNVEFYMPGDTWMAEKSSPFYILDNEKHLDSLQGAINALLEFTERRDSTRILINDTYGQKTPFWITTGHDDSYRFWVKNYNYDSISLWVGNPARGEISLLLEDDVKISRMAREEIQHLPSFIVEPERNLYDMEMLVPVPIYWDYEFSSAFSMSQTYLSPSWTKGGESSFSSMLDLMGKATYNNKDQKTQWINIARLKFGTVWTKSKKGFRKNHDQFEIDSRYNRNAWGKIGMSASFYMKNQLAQGRKHFSNDSSVVVSKFLNPGTLTLGLGAEYKPFEKTTINIAPISYKTTFVFDTAHIDQTAHGIDADSWAKRELGLQVVVNNKFSPFKGMEVINRARLFSNYLHKPQNIDIDWEVVIEQKINWFFTIRLNLHLIYDDDVHSTLYDSDDNPVLNPDGSELKAAQIQFKEFIGLALNFKF